MKKITIFTGNRAEYGLLRNLIKLLNKDKNIDLRLIISGSHLSKTLEILLKKLIEMILKIP